MTKLVYNFSLSRTNETSSDQKKANSNREQRNKLHKSSPPNICDTTNLINGLFFIHSHSLSPLTFFFCVSSDVLLCSLYALLRSQVFAMYTYTRCASQKPTDCIVCSVRGRQTTSKYDELTKEKKTALCMHHIVRVLFSSPFNHHVSQLVLPRFNGAPKYVRMLRVSNKTSCSSSFLLPVNRQPRNWPWSRRGGCEELCHLEDFSILSQNTIHLASSSSQANYPKVAIQRLLSTPRMLVFYSALLFVSSRFYSGARFTLCQRFLSFFHVSISVLL